FVVGAVIDLTPALFLLVPILLPVSTHFGVDPVHFGVIMVANLSVGLITPPVGTVLYVGTTIGAISLPELVRELAPIYLILFLVVLMITYITPAVLWLPSLF
ncbi:MAG: TRAP transporter large permease subunit, partial [Spirochaetales bacterium]|nr:TRAP transporter large permease subunit [Spirochaetales bacterium]